MDHKASVPVLIGKRLLLVLYALFALFPLAWMIILSLKTQAEVLTTEFVFHPTFENYVTVINGSGGVDYATAFRNNLVVSTLAVALSMVVGVPAAYALARFKFRGKENIAFTFLSFRFAPELFVILPLFFIYQKLGLIGSYFGLIWVYQLITLPLIIWVLRGFFEDIPRELDEAAQIDGCTWWQSFIQVMLPLVRPGMVSAGLMSFIFAWNAFTFPLLLGGDLQTSTVAILSYISSVTVNYGQVAAAATISILPSVVLALFVQKHLVRGLSFGAVKG